MMEMCWDLPDEKKENCGNLFKKMAEHPPTIIVLDKVTPPPPQPPPPRCSQTLKRSKRCRFGDPSL